MNISKSLDLVIKYYRSGNITESENLCRKILEKEPENVEALHFLGVICYQKGQHDSAITYIQKVLEIEPKFIDAYNNLGNILQAQKRFTEASNCYKKALALNPNLAQTCLNLGIALQEEEKIEEALHYYQKALELGLNSPGIYNNIGLALQKQRRYEEAKAHYEKAIEIDSDYPIYYYNLANLLKELNEVDRAILCYQRALQLNPVFGEAYNNLGLILQKKGLSDEAENCYKKAIQINSNLIEAYNNFGNLLKDTGRRDEAIAFYQQALQKNPYFSDAYYNLGSVLKEEERLDEAIAAFDMASYTNPANLKAYWARCMSHLPMIYQEQSSIEVSRNRYQRELRRLTEIFTIELPQNIEAAADAVGSHQPFYLAYQGYNDCELQKIYGELVCRIMGSRYPQFARQPSIPLFKPDRKIKVGIISGFFYNHSNWKIPIKGWIEKLNKNKFNLYGYYTGATKDGETLQAKACFDRFIEDVDSFENLCRIIKDDKLHVILYPEIGMDPVTVKLAALRHAPVQCTSWGHPETSGLPTIDYFLSSDLMEPPDAKDHYTEELIRLPNLSICYIPPDVKGTEISRNTFGLEEASILYLCCQSLYKYLPQYDELYPRIAKEVGNCRFLFISHQKSRLVTEKFVQRIRHAFAQYSLRSEDYIVMLPRFDQSEYHALNMIADIYLDSIGWSGCNSTFEAIACNLPVVTIPGALMRGRHSAAILTMMGITETIANTIDEYIDIAVRLGRNQTWRHHMAEEIKMKKHLVYNDRACIAAIEDFLVNVVKGMH